MKFLTIYVTILVYAFALVVAKPFSTNVKCQFNCDMQDYDPICGTDDSGDSKTFNNLCIMRTENCLRNLSFQKTGDGDCP